MGMLLYIIYRSLVVELLDFANEVVCMVSVVLLTAPARISEHDLVQLETHYLCRFLGGGLAASSLRRGCCSDRCLPVIVLGYVCIRGNVHVSICDCQVFWDIYETVVSTCLAVPALCSLDSPTSCATSLTAELDWRFRVLHSFVCLESCI